MLLGRVNKKEGSAWDYQQALWVADHPSRAEWGTLSWGHSYATVLDYQINPMKKSPFSTRMDRKLSFITQILILNSMAWNLSPDQTSGKLMAIQHGLGFHGVHCQLGILSLSMRVVVHFQLQRPVWEH